MTWYDLPLEGRDAYLSWLHETHIPGLLKRSGFLWAAHYASVDKATIPKAKDKNRTDDASVPASDRYILLVGAEDANVFLNPVPTALRAELPDESKKMLALRISRARTYGGVCQSRGPAIKEYQDGMALAPCVQIGSYDCRWQHEEEMLAWYTQWRLPAMSRLPGCIRTRKLVSLTGWGKHAVLYEFASVEVRNEYFPKHEDGRPEIKAWSHRMVANLIHAPTSPYLARRIWPAVTDGRVS